MLNIEEPNSFAMKYVTLFHNGNQIEVHNSLMGKETIKYNGEVVSSKSSFFGAKHAFWVIEDGEEVEYKVLISFNWKIGIGFDIFRNGEPLFLTEI